MTSVIYAIILALLLCFLAFKVINARRNHKVRYGDGGVDELQIARSAHANAAEYIPIALLLLFFLEYNHAPLWLVHLLGIAFVIGRLIHCQGILSEALSRRVLGMQLTFISIFILCVVNLIYFPFDRIFLS